MKAVLAAVAIWVGAGPAWAQSPESLIRDVISRQMEAFQADDFVTAFGFASPMIEGIFGSPERFGQMVREGYPMVWRPAKVEFGGLNNSGGQMRQSVLVTDQGGRLHLLEYEMIETSEGWEINGVRFKRPGGFGA